MRFQPAEYEQIRDIQSKVYHPHRTELGRAGSFIDEYRQMFEGGSIAEVFHENTKLNEITRRRQVATNDEMSEPGMGYVQANIDSDRLERELVKLPEDVTLEGDIGSVLRKRRSRRSFTDEPISIRDLSKLLLYGAGVSAEAPIGDELVKPKRTYPSPGGLYGAELYLAARDIEGIDPGLYYYSTPKHGIRRLEADSGLFQADLEDAILTEDAIPIDSTPLFILLSGAFGRITAKYGPRGYRYALQETGHLCQNLLLAAEATGLGGVPLSAYDDRRANDLLGVNGVDEATVYAVGMGYPETTGGNNE